MGGRVVGDRGEVRQRIGQAMEVALARQHAAVDRVDVRVLEARQQRLALQLDHPRARADEVAYVGRAPDLDDPAVSHGHRVRGGSAVHHALDAGAQEHEVGRVGRAQVASPDGCSGRSDSRGITIV